MAIKPFNSINGFSVSEGGNVIIDSAGNITTNSIISTQYANLGSIANVKITGGSSGYVLSTDGAGNLSFISAGSSGSSISNGNSNVNIATANGNVTIAAVGNTTMTVTGTGANIFGYVSASGNANIGNIGTGIITATGNVTGGNLITAGLITATGNITGNYIIGNGSALTGIIASAGAAITNGNSNVTVVANSNITMSVTSTPNVMVVTTTGANITGALTTTGNVNVGNANAVTWANSTGVRAYTYYNNTTASLDTVFI